MTERIKPFHNATVEKAHDVRTIRPCDVCHGMGNKPSMLEFFDNSGAWYRHGRCHIKTRGLRDFIALPQEQTDKMPLSDIGVEAMKSLLLHRDLTDR